MTNPHPWTQRTRSLFLHCLLWAIALSYGFADWGIYRGQFFFHGQQWRMHLSGGIDAPFQYRIGNWVIVDWMYRLLHIKTYDTLTAIDVLCLVLILWLVLHLLKSLNLSRALSSTHFLSMAVALVLAEYYLVWGHWFQDAETLPSILFVVLSLNLVCRNLVRNRALACILLVGLSGLQGFFRADVAVVLHVGFFLALLFRGKISVPLGRIRQLATSLAATLLAGCVQLYLMRVRFPNARYGPGGVVRLASNIHPGIWLTMLLALAPYGVLLILVATKRYQPDGPERMMLTSSLLYLALWATVGLLNETRIFLPFAFGLIPATAVAVVKNLPDSPI
ncbi:MAG TPA: hypothetical protein VN670_02250 [Acidobacteriaceae bacterium]|nr:hypothetical protein [Acidobacteriaceae bacterium]